MCLCDCVLLIFDMFVREKTNLVPFSALIIIYLFFMSMCDFVLFTFEIFVSFLLMYIFIYV